MKAVTLTVLCEGLTEQRFVAQVLRPHLDPQRVFAKSQLLKPGGGIVKFLDLREAVSRILRGRAHECVTTMLDPYELLDDYPDRAAKPGESGAALATRIEAGMRQVVPDRRFVPYIQVHEFEALVLSDLDALAAHLPDDGAAAVRSLRTDIESLDPEDIDEGKDTAPSKRILEALPTYAKHVDGPAITARIGLEKLRERCRHFDDRVVQLEKLAPRHEPQ